MPLQSRHARFSDEIVIAGKTFKVQRLRAHDMYYVVTLSCDRTRLETFQCHNNDDNCSSDSMHVFRHICKTLHNVKACLESPIESPTCDNSSKKT